MQAHNAVWAVVKAHWDTEPPTAADESPIFAVLARFGTEDEAKAYIRGYEAAGGETFVVNYDDGWNRGGWEIRAERLTAYDWLELELTGVI